MINHKTTHMQNNKMELSGQIISDIELVYNKYNEDFYGFELAVLRDSGERDVLPITISKILLLGKDIQKMDFVSVTGEIRTHNEINEKTGRTRLKLNVFAKSIEQRKCQEEYLNNISLDGFICKEPKYRVTPLGRQIADALLAINRNYHKTDYIPCIVWGRNAVLMSNLKVGCHVCIVGRFQSRDYLKTNEETGKQENKRAYEVSVSTIELPDMPLKQ